jgi:UDP-N-acetylmuramate--alanine ligase
MTVILQQAGQDPSFVIGGEISQAGASGHHGNGPHFVVEADESDKSFLVYRPHVAIITNIEGDHLNNWVDLDGLKAGFLQFAELTDPEGFVVTCADDEGTQGLIAALRAAGRTVYTYGEAEDADLRLTDFVSTAQGVRFQAALDGKPLGELSLALPGRHMGLNSAAAVLTALRLGMPLPAITEALASFPGVRRRFERKGMAAGVRVYDEYAYHPTSVKAALRTLREVAGDGRLVVVFQPYRVYRTRDLQTELAEGLAIADEVIVMEVFGPGEQRGPGEGGVALTAAIDKPEADKVFVASWEEVPAEVVRRSRPGDVVVTMGAPPISMMGDELLAALAES